VLAGPQPFGEAHVRRVNIDEAKLRVRNVPEAMRDARRRRHEASRPGPEDIIPDLKLGLSGKHVERVDVVVVGVRINSLEVGAESQLDDLELWKLPENAVMSLPAHELFPAFRAECDDAVHGHVASLSDRVPPLAGALLKMHSHSKSLATCNDAYRDDGVFGVESTEKPRFRGVSGELLHGFRSIQSPGPQ
jgi:hypothetical protein